VDRSTFIASPDGALDITGDVSDVTVQNSLFYGTTLTQLIKYYTRMRISLHHNVYTAGGERNPQIKGDATKFDFVSNVVHANTLTADSYGTLLWNGNSSSDSPGNIQINMVANAYVGTNGTIAITTDSGASPSGIYIASNNYCSPSSNCPSSPSSAPFTVDAGYGVTPTLPGCMVANMLPTVGSPNRTATDTLKINAVAAALPNTCGVTTPALSIGDASVAEGNAGTTTANFTVTLSAPATSTVTVNYATANGTATAGSDYVAASGTLSFPVGTTSRPIAITVVGDTTVEPNETFVVNLSAPSGATLLDAQGVGTITNDDVACTPVQISIADKSITEGNSGTQLLAFPVSLSAASNCTVSVSYATANGTATAGSDYVAAAASLTFAPGVTTQNVFVTVNGDKVLEGNETLVVNLSAPSAGATLLDSQAVGTIVNDDVAGFSVNDVTVVEPVSGTVTATFTVTLAPAAAGSTSVSYATANGTATAGGDYVAKSGTLTFAAGVTTQTVAIVVNADAVREAIETFTLNLTNPTGGPAIADAQGTGRIYNTGAYFTVTPCRLVDTRNSVGALAGPALSWNAVRTFTLAGACGIPANARALALNVTVTAPTGPGDLRIYPAGVAVPPLASVVNYTAGRTRSNNLTVSVNAAGQIAVRCDQGQGTVHFILDVAGYYL
jgi:hypothetical protein